MTKQILKLLAFGAAACVAAAQAQTSPGGTPGTGSQDTSGSQYRPGSSRHFSETGRSGQQDVRASKLIGSNVKGSSGEELGTINDVILNPMSGRIDFAVLSLSSSSSSSTGNSGTTGTTGTSGTSGTTGNSSTSGTSGTSGNLSSTSSSGAGKLVAVPWNLLRPSSTGGYGATSEGQQSFTFAGDSSKLQAAPSFDQSNWPDISQPTWRQSVYSHFGMPGSSTGGASSPGSSSSGTGTSPSTPPSSTPDSGKP